MKFSLAFALFVLVAQTASAQQQWSLGYWTPWGNPSLPPSAIEWSGLTHVVHWAALVQPDGTLDLNTQLVSTDGPTLISTGHAHGVKVLLGLTQGVWLGQTNTIQPAITNNLSTLVTNIMSVVNSYGFDGVDIDWEPFSVGTNGAAMQQFAAAMRAQLGTRLFTSAAITNDFTFWGSVQSYFDRIQVMTYDLTGTWNPYSWHNAALYSPSDNAVWSVDMTVSRFTGAGVPASKLSIGIPFYGWQWSGGGVTGPQQLWSTTPSLTQIYYQRLGSNIAAGTYHWDTLAQVSYVSGSNSFLTYDDPPSVAAKVNYAKSKGLGGWIIWELSSDYIPTQTPDQPLLDAIKNAMGPSAPSITTTSLPSATQSLAYSTTLAASGGTAPYTWSISSGTLPSGLGLAASSGTISGTPSGAGTSSFTVKVTDATSLTATQALSITVNGSTTTVTITITPTSLPSGAQNSPYTTTLTATGGAPPYAWSIASGSLPAGLSLGSSTSNSVVISGTPTGSGVSTFTVQVTDPGTPSGTQALSISVAPPATLTPFAIWKLDETSGATASDSSGNNNTLTLNNAPAWLSSSSCMINGCLSFNGTNQSGSAATLNLSDTNIITVAFWMYWNTYSSNDSLAMESTPNFNNATTGFMIDPNSSQGTGTQFEAGLRGDAGYNQVSFARPSQGAWHHYAFVFNKGATAALQVTPYVDGVAVAYTKPTSAQNTNNFGADSFYLLSRAASSLFGGGRLDDVRIYKRALAASEIVALATATLPPSITTTSLPSDTQNIAYSDALGATGGTTPYTWSIASGTLPSGLALASATGVISGTPTASGTSSFTVKLTDATSLTATQALSITVNAPAPPPPSITTTSLPIGTQSTAYSATLAATGGTTPYTWSIASGTLPSGLALASATGVISGTPTASGTSSFTVKLTDATSLTATQALSITVNAPAPPSLSITTTSLPSGVRNRLYNATLAATGGTTPYTWSIASGTLPSGLALAPATGVISGTPTASGTSSFTVKVTGATALTATRALSITVRRR